MTDVPKGTKESWDWGSINLSDVNIDVDKDWNAKRITNLGAPVNDNDAARKVDVTGAGNRMTYFPIGAVGGSGNYLTDGDRLGEVYFDPNKFPTLTAVYFEARFFGGSAYTKYLRLYTPGGSLITSLSTTTSDMPGTFVRSSDIKSSFTTSGDYYVIYNQPEGYFGSVLMCRLRIEW
ncbi:MAG: hypothetical protein ACTSX6_00365 [Candidatus Heimdallarchaeaceae archaeon]